MILIDAFQGIDAALAADGIPPEEIGGIPALSKQPICAGCYVSIICENH